MTAVDVAGCTMTLTALIVLSHHGVSLVTGAGGVSIARVGRHVVVVIVVVVVVVVAVVVVVEPRKLKVGLMEKVAEAAGFRDAKDAGAAEPEAHKKQVRVQQRVVRTRGIANWLRCRESGALHTHSQLGSL